MNKNSFLKLPSNREKMIFEYEFFSFEGRYTDVFQMRKEKFRPKRTFIGDKSSTPFGLREAEK